MTGFDRSIISDADVKSLDDLNRLYPLPAGYEYRADDQGQFVVARQSDGATFFILAEAGLLTFDVPAPDRPGKKTTTEVFKKA